MANTKDGLALTDLVPCTISAVSYEGLSVTTPDGRPATLAVVDSERKILASGRDVEHAIRFPYAAGCDIKYVSRWHDRGALADLKKARHFPDLLIELEGRSDA